MTHWDHTGGSPWLDHFLGNLTAERRGRIKYLAQHDYSGDAAGIVSRADAAYKKCTVPMPVSPSFPSLANCVLN